MDEVCDVLRRFDDERDYDDMSEAALLKRKREERSNWNVTRAHARDTDAEMREHRGTQGHPGRVDMFVLNDYLRNRERGGTGFNRRDVRVSKEALVTRAPYAIEEHELPSSLLSKFDKCFAAKWLTHNQVVLGTKDNSLAIVDVASGQCRQIKLPARNLASPRLQSWRNTIHRRVTQISVAPSTTSAFYSGDVLTRVSSAPNQHALMHVDAELVCWLEGSVDGIGRDIRGMSPQTPELFHHEIDVDSENTSQLYPTHFENCGIHAISLNPGNTRLATGGDNPCDAAIFSVIGDGQCSRDGYSPSSGDKSTLTPSALLVGHRDWVFGLDWISNNLVASCSRDKTVKIWSVPERSSSLGERQINEITSPVATIRAHGEKVRDVKYVSLSKRLASLSTDGVVKFTDPLTMGVSETKKLRSKRELMCLATDGAMIAAGSQSAVAFLDHRHVSRVVEKKLPEEDNDGVRSLSYANGGKLLTIGGGGGKIFFFDVAGGEFLPQTGLSEKGDNAFGEAETLGTVEERNGGSSGADDKLPTRLFGVHGGRNGQPRVINEPRLNVDPSPNSHEQSVFSLCTGEGFLDREDNVFIEHFSLMEDWYGRRNACYAHCWDCTGTRLLVTGGPLAYGLKGCYVGVWR